MDVPHSSLCGCIPTWHSGSHQSCHKDAGNLDKWDSDKTPTGSRFSTNLNIFAAKQAPISTNYNIVRTQISSTEKEKLVQSKFAGNMTLYNIMEFTFDCAAYVNMERLRKLRRWLEIKPFRMTWNLAFWAWSPWFAFRQARAFPTFPPHPVEPAPLAPSYLEPWNQ